MRVGDYGPPARVYRLVNKESSLPLDLTTMVSCTLRYTKPSGTVVLKSATVKNPPGTDGRIEYTIEQGLLTEAGFWSVRAVTVFSAPSQWTSETVMFEVEP